MNKIILNSQQIDYLKEFIRKRGFSEPVEIHEILDHFACKVEEIMAQNPRLNLDQAMYQAHHSFGVLGFRPIIQSMEEKLKRKYALAYFKTYTNLKFYPIIAAMAYLGYLLFHFFDARQINMVYDNDVWLMIFVIYIVSDVHLSILFKTNIFNIDNYYVKLIRYFPFGYYVIFIFILPTNSSLLSEKFQIGGLYAALQLAFITMHTIAKYKSLKAAQDDNKNFLYRKEEL